VNNTPVTVYLRAARTTERAGRVRPFELGDVHRANVYTAYGSEKPVISGGIKVASSWSTYSGSIQVATIATNLKVDQLFLNGQRQVLARYPITMTQDT